MDNTCCPLIMLQYKEPVSKVLNVDLKKNESRKKELIRLSLVKQNRYNF